jgi:hypothetical protein
MHTIILIVAIEITLITQITNVYKSIGSSYNDKDLQTLLLNITVTIGFVVQDMLFGFVWVIYGTPKDSFKLYNDIEVTNFSIFQREGSFHHRRLRGRIDTT